MYTRYVVAMGLYQTSPQNKGPLKVLFLSADTGGGHRASAESLANQFLIHYPGSTYDLLDIWSADGIKPYNTLVKAYKHLSAHPRQWRFLYHLSNSRPWEIGMDLHSTFMCEKRIRKRIASYDPDVVVSVHPAMNYAPLVALKKICKATGRHIPFFTVVTDLGSGHCTWFHRTVDKLFVASERLRRLAKRRGRTPDNKIVMTGLPIRNDFSVQSKQMGDRTSESGQAYQLQMKQQLLAGTSSDAKVPLILVMGGGEGVGSLSEIVDEIYTSCTKRGVDATICVVCGRNEKLQSDLQSRNWSAVVNREQKIRIKSRIPFLGERKRSIAIQRALNRAKQEPPQALGKVNVIGLGFITNMADYMVGAEVLVTKAGPGTIAEAAAVGLPIMLTSFLPGQEAGNVDYVLDYGFGDYSEDPVSIAEEVTTWLQDSTLLQVMSHRAQAAGRPNAASEIVLDIGSETQVWKALNDA
jgi:1,2-diacylglycerol 3-beta-galactosyltransferase